MASPTVRLARLGLPALTLVVLALAPDAQSIVSKSGGGSLPPAAGAGSRTLEVPYRKLTNTRRTFTNFNVEVVRGFVILGDPGLDEFDLYAVNAYESTVTHHADPHGEPDARWRTVTNPVSIAEWNGDLLVVGQGNHAIARHDLPNGEIVDFLTLRSEPADIVVDTENDEAWVSCMGDDSVVQIDLTPPMSVVKIWSWGDGLLLKRPRFLHIELNTPSPTDNEVFVAPLVSGNNTLFLKQTPGDLTDTGLVDGRTLPGSPPGLPDEDLFRITTSPDAVQPVVRDAGSLILAHGKNPSTQDYWMLTVDHLNASGPIGEPAIRGQFADNLLRRVSTGSPFGTALVEPFDRIDLDDWDSATPGAQYDPERSLSFPYALEFEPGGTGRAAIASSTTPLVVLVDASGQRVFEYTLAAQTNNFNGTVARTIRFHGDGLWVYCQGTSNILGFRTGLPGGPLAEIKLGNDPTPDPVKRGRDTWYDATRSMDGRTTCNTCHPQGGADGLAWLISNDPVDEKGLMVTQTLIGVEDSFPYHWRGERDLEAFNKAFPGLLGTAAALDPQSGELDDFVEFVFSLTSPANPAQNGPATIDANGRIVQDYDRVLKDALAPDPVGVGIAPTGSFPHSPAPGSPVRGDFVFHEIPLISSRTCQECHLNPTGSNGDVTGDGATQIGSKSNLKVAHLDTQLTLKDQPIVDVVTNGGSKPRNLLGFGTSHMGDRTNLFGFNLRFFPSMTAQEIFDLTSFVRLFDHGIAPSVHYGARLHAGEPAGTALNVRRWLLDQAARNWVGVVAFGTFADSQGAPVRVHWYYDPASKTFIPEDVATFGPQPFSAFLDFAAHPFLDNVFLGVPPGNERRLGVDFDDDGLDTAGELANQTDPWNPDSDDDGWPDGYEVKNPGDPLDSGVPPVDSSPPTLTSPITVNFVNAVSAKYLFRTNEPATWTITLDTPNGPQVIEDRRTADRIHTAVVQRLLPSTIGFSVPADVENVYTGSLVLTDLSGNSSPAIPMPAVRTTDMVHLGLLEQNVIGRLDLSNEARTLTTYGATVDLRVDFKEQGPPAIAAPDRIFVCQVLKEAANGKDWEIVPLVDLAHTAPATDFVWGETPMNYGQTPGLLPGPFLVLPPTAGDGLATVDFTVFNLTANQPVMFNVLAVLTVPQTITYDPNAPVFPWAEFKSITRYQLPATPEPLRRAVSTL